MISSLLLCGSTLAQPTFNYDNAPLNIEDASGTPSTFPYKLKVTTGSLVDNGDGTATLSTGSSHTHTQYVTLDQNIPQHIQGKPNITGLQFDNTPQVGAVSAGKLYWDSTYKTLSLNNDANVNLQIGQENLIRVIAGENISNGDVVYFSGSSGVFPLAMKARANTVETGRVKGLATENIPIGTEGFVCNFGIIHDLNTNSFATGDLVYLSGAVAGAITATRPAPPLFQIVVGRVVVKDAIAGSIYRSSSPNYPISGDQVDLQREFTPSAVSAPHSVQDWFNTYSVGMVSGGTITAIGPSHVTVTAGTGISAIGTLDTDPVAFMDWDYIQATMTDQRVNWIAVNYNSGSPHVTVYTGSSSSDYSVPTQINYQNIFPLGYVTKNGSDLYVTNNPRRIQDSVGGLIRRFYQTLPLARDEKLGGLILGETGTRNITLSSGKLWDRQNQFTIGALDTSADNVFSTWYRGAVAGTFTETENVTQWPNTQYDNGSGTLQTVAANRFANLWWYLSTEGQVAMVYGRNLYTSAAAASAGSIPATLPLPLNAHYRLIGRTTFQGSAATFTANDSVFTNTFTASAVTSHNNLSGLQGGTTGEYYHMTAAEDALAATYCPMFPFYDLETKLYSAHSHSNYTTDAYGKNTSHAEYTPYSVYGTHSHSNYSASTVDTSKIAKAHSEYVPYSVYGVHTHSGYSTGASVYQSINQAHSFNVGNVLKFSGGVYALAQADSAADAEVVGIVSAVTDGNNFTLLYSGYINTMTGLTANTTYFLSPSSAGGLTTTEPITVGQISKPLLVATSATTGYFFNYRGVVIASPATSSGVSFQSAVYPQALHDIEYLRHSISSYQNYGDLIVDGLQDQTGVGATTNLSYTGSSNYYYGLSAGSDGTGGTISHSGGKTIHTFKLADSGTNFTPPSALTVTYLVVAGGGGAGSSGGNCSAGGGAGGYKTGTLAVTATPYTITVGDGGAGGVGAAGTNGADSIFSSITSTGGGGGGSSSANSSIKNGKDGGSGGGAAANSGAGTVGAANPAGQGNAGSLCNPDGTGSGAGGGAGATGGAYSGQIGAPGGDGLSNSISGTSIPYAGGGGGGSYLSNPGGAGGAGGGGAGGNSDTPLGTPGTSDRGGGAGGCGPSSSGAKGGSGVVIISYTTPTSIPSGFLHSTSFPVPLVPVHLGVSIKLDSALVNGQHYYLTAQVSRDGGTTFTDCHPITKIGTAGYYMAQMKSVAGQPSGSSVVAKVGLANSTTAKIKGYSIYGE